MMEGYSKSNKIILIGLLLLLIISGSTLIYFKYFDIVDILFVGGDYKSLTIYILKSFDNATFGDLGIIFLCIIGFIIIGYIIIEKLLLNYDDIHFEIDLGSLPIAWLMYYFGAAGCFLGIQPLRELGMIHTFILFAGIVYLFAASQSYDSGVLGFFIGILRFIVALIVLSVVYLFCAIMIWITIIFIICSIWRNISNMGPSTYSENSVPEYNQEAQDLNRERDDLLNGLGSLSETSIQDLQDRIDAHNQKD